MCGHVVLKADSGGGSEATDLLSSISAWPIGPMDAARRVFNGWRGFIGATDYATDLYQYRSTLLPVLAHAEDLP